ncbi:hypothetical protein ElyMa_004345700 [Elysia marginata]|uniref:Uncharacterized protein n=1 Tax=Elysia marginata TaxID=1093978 RepID=A0AAV4H269_9GAST|nr:hypothetical protein ElyMa_004345700 [Elysia marginata]
MWGNHQVDVHSRPGQQVSPTHHSTAGATAATAGVVGDGWLTSGVVYLRLTDNDDDVQVTIRASDEACTVCGHVTAGVARRDLSSIYTS